MIHISRYHLLHPVAWLGWLIVIKYGSYLFTNSISLFPDLLFFLAAVGVFVAPLVLLPVKDLAIKKDFLRYIVQLKQSWAWIIYLTLVIARFWMINDMGLWYGELKTGTPTVVYVLEVAGWLFSYYFLASLKTGKHWLNGFPIAFEMIFLGVLGMRTWLIMWGLGIILIIHLYHARVNWKMLVTGALFFIVILSPLSLILRYAAYEDVETQRSFFQVAGQEFLDYGSYISATFSRIGAEGAVLHTLVGSDDSQRREKILENSPDLWNELKLAIVPRVFWPEKPSIRPGEKVYKAFISDENPQNISYPAGIIGETFWQLGWWAFLVLPLISTGLVFLWNYLIVDVCHRTAWFGLHFFYFHLFFDNHLVFWATSWIRDGLLYAVLIIAGIYLNRHTYHWLTKKSR